MSRVRWRSVEQGRVWGTTRGCSSTPSIPGSHRRSPTRHFSPATTSAVSNTYGTTLIGKGHNYYLLQIEIVYELLVMCEPQRVRNLCIFADYLMRQETLFGNFTGQYIFTQTCVLFYSKRRYFYIKTKRDNVSNRF